MNTPLPIPKPQGAPLKKTQGGPLKPLLACVGDISTLLGICSLLALGCNSLPGKPKPGPEVPRPDSIMDFATLYRQNCRACHGEEGVNGPSYPAGQPGVSSAGG